jgi:hypothetical protein
MARNHARILTSIWSDPDFTTLARDEQRIYILALSQPNLNLCGIVPYTARRWARLAPDTTPKAVSTSVNRLVAANYLLLDAHTEEVLVRTFVRHDGVLRSPNLIVAMSRDYGAIQSATLRQAFMEGLPEGFPQGLREGFLKGFKERLPEGFWQRLSEQFREELPEPSPRACAEPARGELPLPLPHPPPPPSTSVGAQTRTPKQPGRPAAPPHGDEDDEAPEDETPAGPDRIREADGTLPADAPDAIWNQLAAHDLDQYLAAGGTIERSRRGWLTTAAANRRNAHGDQAAALHAAGLNPAAIVERILHDDQTNANPPGLGERRPPGVEETRKLIDRLAGEEAEIAGQDARIAALEPAALAELERLAAAEARAAWSLPTEPPAAMVRSFMRARVAAVEAR